MLSETKLKEGINPAGYIPLQLSQVDGPFRCAQAQCSFTYNSPTAIGKHWILQHSDMAANSSTVSLYQVYTYIVQCRVYGAVRCARDVLGDW